METIKIEGREFFGMFNPIHGESGFNFVLDNGDYVKGIYNGHQNEEILLAITFDSDKQFEKNRRNHDIIFLRFQYT